jgi:hypothetical protein
MLKQHIIDNILPKERGTEEQVQATHCGLYHWNDCLHEVHAVLPDIIEYVYKDLRERVGEMRKGTARYFPHVPMEEAIRAEERAHTIDEFLSLLQSKEK